MRLRNSGGGVFDPPSGLRSKAGQRPCPTFLSLRGRPALREGAAIHLRLQMDHHVASLLVMTIWEGSFSSIIQAQRLGLPSRHDKSLFELDNDVPQSFATGMQSSQVNAPDFSSYSPSVG